MTFKCIPVGETGQFMVADMSVACFEGEWLVWATVAGIAMAFYVVGIPFGCMALLWIAQKRGVLQFPKIQISDETQLIPSVIVESVRRTEEYLHINVAFSALYEQYEKMFWWFESCCTMRKMILTGAMVLFGAGTTPQGELCSTNRLLALCCTHVAPISLLSFFSGHRAGGVRILGCHRCKS